MAAKFIALYRFGDKFCPEESIGQAHAIQVDEEIPFKFLNEVATTFGGTGWDESNNIFKRYYKFKR